jgi:inorganic pyrophosphatase
MEAFGNGTNTTGGAGSTLSDGGTTAIILVGVLVGLIWAWKYYSETISMSTKIMHSEYDDHDPLVGDESKENGAEPAHIQTQLNEVSQAIQVGAQGFLSAEYEYMAVFMVLMSIMLLVLLGTRKADDSWVNALFSVIAFIVGGVTSILCGWIGMKIAVQANVRVAATAYNNPDRYEQPFAASFKAGAVMGFSLCALAVGVLFVLVNAFKLHFDTSTLSGCGQLYECIAGYGFGGSSIALFGRVGGGIYTKAADVGADIFKLDGLKEDDPRNPAVIADNVGDNVGDIAGMGADLFGSFAESASAAMLISSKSEDLYTTFGAMCFPMIIGSAGILVCLVTSLFATSCCLVSEKGQVEESLKRQLIISTVLMTPVTFILCWFIFP